MSAAAGGQSIRGSCLSLTLCGKEKGAERRERDKEGAEVIESSTPRRLRASIVRCLGVQSTFGPAGPAAQREHRRKS